MSSLVDTLNNEELSLEEKLAAIDKAMASKQINREVARPGDAPVDPMDDLMCMGCQ